MISAAIRVPSLSRQTQFDLGEARVISIDLDEVAKGGGDAADRQTAVMYMLSRYVMAKDYYLTQENLPKIEQITWIITGVSKTFVRVSKRIVYDEFHRTSKAEAVATK